MRYRLGRPLKNIKAVKYIACTEGNTMIRIQELDNPHMANNFNFLFYTYPTNYPRIDSDEFEPVQDKNLNAVTVELLNMNFNAVSIDPSLFQLVLAFYTEK